MYPTKKRTNVLNRSSQLTKIARMSPLASITLGLCLHATRPTPDVHKPASRATLDPLAETVENAPVRPSPYDRTFAPLQLATSSITLLRAFEHIILHQKQPFSGKSPCKSSSTYHEFLCIHPSPSCIVSYTRSGKKWLQKRTFPPFPRLPLPGLLLLESPLSRTPAFVEKPSFPTASRRVHSTLTPEVNLSEQGRLVVSGLHYAGAALVDHVVLKGVKVEMQADSTMFTQALAFVAPHTTDLVIRGVQFTFPLRGRCSEESTTKDAFLGLPSVPNTELLSMPNKEPRR